MLTKDVFSKKVVLITGPAGNLGSAVVEQFLEVGSSLILIDNRTDRLVKLFPKLVTTKDHLLIPEIDLTNFNLVNKAVSEGVKQFNRIDILVHTAGGFQMGEKVHEITESSWNFLLDLNLKTLLNITKAVVPHMVDQKSGKIITIGARPSLAGKAKMGAYGVAKAGVLRLTESLAAELKPTGINVNCVIPGTIDTPQNRKSMPGADTSKWVTPESLANIIKFLASEEAKDIHGAAIPAYGA